MSSAIEEFQISLYREHLEEASALYDLRKTLLVDPEREWTSLHDFEARLEAHIDALVVGGEPALQVCEEQMREGDAGELFAGLSVCCRQERAPLFAQMWREFDFGNPMRVRAATDALKLELPDAWVGGLARAIEQGDEKPLPILAVAAAHRRLPVGPQLAGRIAAMPEPDDPRFVWALARLSGDGVAAALQKCLRAQDPEVRSLALRGLLRAADQQALQSCYLAAQAEQWPHLGLGLAGDRQAAIILRQQLEGGRASRDTLMGLALLGDVTTVSALVAALEAYPIGETAAMALHWITGAPLFEDVFVPDPIDESELFEGEKAAWKERGEVPRRADGKPYGTEIRRLSRKPEVWNQWLGAHASEFDPSVRYRRGRPCSARAVFECIIAPTVPPELRQLAFEEMVIRYGCDAAFEADSRVADQLASLHGLAAWLQQNEPRLDRTLGRFFRGGA